MKGFKPGTPKPPTSGRAKGTPNRKTQTLIDKCEAKGFEPFDALLDMAADLNQEPIIRLGALKDLCSYLYPKRKELAHSFQDPKILNELEKLSECSADELQSVVKQETKKK